LVIHNLTNIKIHFCLDQNILCSGCAQAEEPVSQNGKKRNCGWLL